MTLAPAEGLKDLLPSLWFFREDFFLPNVDIMNAGDSISDMYIIASGKMKAFVKDYERREVR